MVASMATRPCWISITRRRLNCDLASSTFSYWLNSKGSQKPNGGVMPISAEKSTAVFPLEVSARNGESTARLPLAF